MTIDIIGIAAVVTAITAITFAGLAGNRFLKKANRFFDDWYGSAEHDGHPAVPGVLSRLNDLEDARIQTTRVLDTQTQLLNQMSETVGQIKILMDIELGRHGGASTKDVAYEALRIAREIQEDQRAMQLQQENEIIARREWREEYEQDKETTRMEWVAVFKAIRRMIGMEPKDQVDLWDAVTGSYATGRLDDISHLTAQPE